MKQRVLAIIGAVALIAIAMVLRATVMDGGGDGASNGKATKGKPVVACAPDLVAICTALASDGAIASNPPTLDLADATAPPDDVDGWLTWDPAPAIANIDAPNTWGPSVPVGGASLAVGSRTGTTLTLPTGCRPATLTWTCVAAAAQRGTAVGVGTADSAESLARLYPLAKTLVPTDGDFTTIDGSALKAIVGSPNDPQADFPDQLVTLQTKLGALGLLVGPEGALSSASNVTVRRPSPAAQVTVVLASRTGHDLGDLHGAFTRAGAAAALGDAGVTAGQGRLAPDSRAGELYVVRKKVG